MRLLLDTHVFLWYISKDKRLPDAFLNSIRSLDNEVYLSVVSFWETLVKYQLGKIELPDSPELYFPEQRRKHQIVDLDLDEPSVAHLRNLPHIHKDPFDRMLICQALEHDLTIVTVDEQIVQYEVPVFNS